jgi:hypothetical protein
MPCEAVNEGLLACVAVLAFTAICLILFCVEDK